MGALEAMVAARRGELICGPQQPRVRNLYGLALSGGGIRSATFCFGLLRSLARNGLLLRFDLMSTVSGGGYIGATVGRLFDRAQNAADVHRVAGAIGNGDATWFSWWLRANGRYLLPRGAKDLVFASALFLRNLAGVHFELGLLALLLGVLVAGIDLGGWAVVDRLGYHPQREIFDLMREVPAWLPVVTLAWVLFAFVALCLAAAYWCVPWIAMAPRWTLTASLPAALILAITGAGGLSWFEPFMLSPIGSRWRWALAAAAIVLALAWMFGALVAWYCLRCATLAAGISAADHARNRLTRGLSYCLWGGLGVLLLALLDRSAWFLAFDLNAVPETGFLLGVTAAVGRALWPLAATMGARPIAGPLLLRLVRVLGYVLGFVLCAWWMSVVYRAGLGVSFRRLGPGFAEAAGVLGLIAVPVVLYLLASGQNLSFLNLSSLHPFYRARLVRSYLGAANPARFRQRQPLGSLDDVPPPAQASRPAVLVDELAADDDVAMTAYCSYRHGGPVHLINACVNETTDPRGGLFNQDRRGLPLTIAPGGLFRLSQQGWRKMPKESQLTLGSWTAISGAAVAPGLGRLTRGGVAALAAFAGVRLGYWWLRTARLRTAREGTSPGRAWVPSLRKSRGLLREAFGVFSGDRQSDWFVTDGGHFDNTGAYALLAQRCSLIVLADCGADPAYAFGDLEDLVRKARIDLGARVELLRPRSKTGRADVTGLSAFGSLGDLQSSDSSACLALAKITYAEGDATGLLIVVKPSLCDDLPIDLKNFKAQSPGFPQEATADQFFSEAQWESYFQLGDFIGGHLNGDLLQRLMDDPGEFFEADVASPKDARRKHASASKAAGAACADPQSGAGAPKRPGNALDRIPSRVAVTAAGATLSLTAATTIGVSVWQALDTYRASESKRTEEEGKALKQLSDLWSKLNVKDKSPRNGATMPEVAAVGALAAELLRTADVLCPSGQQSWFQRSLVAADAYDSAIRHCRQLQGRPDIPQACQMLLEADHPALSRPLPDCLAPRQDEQSIVLDRAPRYWYYDYATQARPVDAHPCDLIAANKSRAEERLARGQFLFQLASGDAQSPDSGEATNECRPRSDEGSMRAASTCPEAPVLCSGQTVHVQVHGRPDHAERVRDYAVLWRQRGARVAPVVDVLASARYAGRVPPLEMGQTVVLYHDEQKPEGCLNALNEAVGVNWKSNRIPLNRQAIPGLIEIWISRHDDLPQPRACSTPTLTGTPTSAPPPPRPDCLLGPGESISGKFAGSERRAYAKQLAERAERDDCRSVVVEALVGAIQKEDDPFSYRINLYVAYTLGQIKGWAPQDGIETIKKIDELRGSPNYKDPTFKARVDEALRSARQ